MCVEFFLDNPFGALKNLRSLIPRGNQCINEKLNSLAFFSILFSVFLYVAKVNYAWMFGLFGVMASILLKIVYFDGDNGKLTIDEYSSGVRITNMKDIQKFIPNEPTGEFQDLSDQVHFINTGPFLKEGITKDSSFEDIKDSVTDDILKGRFPTITPMTKMYGDICVV